MPATEYLGRNDPATSQIASFKTKSVTVFISGTISRPEKRTLLPIFFPHFNAKAGISGFLKRSLNETHHAPPVPRITGHSRISFPVIKLETL